MKSQHNQEGKGFCRAEEVTEIGLFVLLNAIHMNNIQSALAIFSCVPLINDSISDSTEEVL